MKRAIVIGASSGIGRELAKVLSHNNYAVGLAARREELLLELQKELKTDSHVKVIDVTKSAQAMKQLDELIEEMNGVDLVVVNAGYGSLNLDLDFDIEKDTIDVNVTGFTAMANTALRHFLKKGQGHLVAISSIAAIRGGGQAPAYNASKAYISNYLEGLRQKIHKQKLSITVTDIQPGFVYTPMAQGELFWVASVPKAAKQIYNAINAKKTHAYISRRWRVIAWLLKIIPESIYNRL